jgi:drug/metabolite transporter (DMT)-like permease
MFSVQTRAAFALTCAVLLWSGNFIAGRALRGEIDPLTLNLVRWTVCLLIFLPWVGSKLWQHRRVVVREWRLLTGLGASGIAAFHTLVYLALTDTTAINALLMLSLAPAAILIGAALVGLSLPSRLQWAGTLVSLAGAAVLVLRGDLGALGDLAFGRGDLWMLCAVVLWAIYSLLLRRRPADLPADVTLAASIVPALVLLLGAVVFQGATLPPPTPRVIGSIAYIAIFASLIAFLLWSHGVDVIGPERAGQFIHLMPLFGAALATGLLGEAIVPSQVAGGVLVFAGIALVQRRGG